MVESDRDKKEGYGEETDNNDASLSRIAGQGSLSGRGEAEDEQSLKSKTKNVKLWLNQYVDKPEKGKKTELQGRRGGTANEKGGRGFVQ